MGRAEWEQQRGRSKKDAGMGFKGDFEARYGGMNSKN